MKNAIKSAFFSISTFVGVSLVIINGASAGAISYSYTSGYGYASGFFSIYAPVCYNREIRVQTASGWTTQKVRVCE
jgi:hypothetical protein